MRIVHLCMCGLYTEGWNYQENVLPKYHVKQGHEVYLIATPYMYEGTKMVLSEDKDYINDAGVHIIRCRVKKGIVGGTRFNRYPELLKKIENICPDILFIHNIQWLDIKKIANYKNKHPECTIYVDSHTDFSNSAKNWFSQNILHKCIWKRRARFIEPFVKKFYGVLPARVEFLKEVYGLPEEKCELLIMGTDDELVEKAACQQSLCFIRKKYNISENDILIMTGGKIDLFKTQTLLLMEAVKQINNSKIRLIVFGSVVEELKQEVLKLSDGKKIQYIGWVNANDSYSLFAAADLVVFPGRHSVFWEQVAGQGIPMLVKYWDGTTHVDFEGNVEFLYQDSVLEIKEKIEEILIPDKYSKMKRAAEKASDNFRYSMIAQKSIK